MIRECHSIVQAGVLFVYIEIKKARIVSNKCYYSFRFYVENIVNTRELRPTNSWCVGPRPGPPDMMEQHARYNHKFYSTVFPSDTVYIASIRNPQKWFISYVDFMGTYR